MGVDPEDEDFNTPEMVGGEKEHTLTVEEMPTHTHVQNPHSHTYPASTAAGNFVTLQGSMTGNNAGVPTGSTTATNKNTGGGEAHSSLQPYVNCYM
jgi:microcystin-dependent protein